MVNKAKKRRSWRYYLGGGELKAARDAVGLSQEKLAEILTRKGVVGIYQRKISRMEGMFEFSVDVDSYRIMKKILPLLQN